MNCRHHNQECCVLCNTDGYIKDPAVRGGDNPHYDFAKPVSNLQELVEVLDPNMDYRRYNILKAAIRWDKKPSLEYNLQKINYFSGGTNEELIEAMRTEIRQLLQVLEKETGRSWTSIFILPHKAEQESR